MEPRRKKRHKKIVNLLALFWGLCEVKIHHKFTDLFLAILSSILSFRFGFYRRRLQSKKRLKSPHLALWKYWKLDFLRRTREKKERRENINASFDKNSNDANKLKPFLLISKKWIVLRWKASKSSPSLQNAKRNFNVNWKAISANQRFHSRTNQYMSLQTNIYNIAFFRLFFGKWFTMLFVKKKKTS